MHVGRRVSRKLRRLIAQRNTTAEQVAFIAGVSKSYLSAILRCKKSPTIKILDKLARALDADIKDLF